MLLAAGATLAVAPKGFATTWSAAQATATREHKPLYLHFTTTWCGWCRRIEQDTYTNADVKKALTNYVAASLDCTVPKGTQPTGVTKINLGLMARYGGQGFPFLVILDEDGTAMVTIDGYLPPREFLAEVGKAQALLEEYKTIAKEAVDAGTHYDLALRALRFYRKLPRSGEQASTVARNLLVLDPENARGDGAEARCVIMQFLPRAKWEKETPVLADEIRKLDPENSKGWLEISAQLHASQELTTADQSEQNDARVAHAKAAVVLLQALVIQPNRLKKAPEDYMLLAQAYYMIDDLDQVIATLEKGLAADPKGPRADDFTNLIKRFKGEKTKGAG